jgi:acetate---CoA ligase (ADP-forming)
VVLNVRDEASVQREFTRMMKIPETKAVLIQPMLSGIELFMGASRYPKFGHVILCGLGGIFIEVLKDVSAGLSPLSHDESMRMIRSLKSYKLIKGVRGQQGVDELKFAEIMQRLSALLEAAPEIQELDFNPLLGKGDTITVVDNRIRIEK